MYVSHRCRDLKQRFSIDLLYLNTVAYLPTWRHKVCTSLVDTNIFTQRYTAAWPTRETQWFPAVNNLLVVDTYLRCHHACIHERVPPPATVAPDRCCCSRAPAPEPPLLASPCIYVVILPRGLPAFPDAKKDNTRNKKERTKNGKTKQRRTCQGHNTIGRGFRSFVRRSTGVVGDRKTAVT